MAVNSNQPVSADNLKSALDKQKTSIGGGIMSLVVPSTADFNYAQFAYLNASKFVCDLDWFSEITVVTADAIDIALAKKYERLSCYSYDGATTDIGTDANGRSGRLTLHGVSGSIGKAYFEMDKQSGYEPKIVTIYGKLK